MKNEKKIWFRLIWSWKVICGVFHVIIISLVLFVQLAVFVSVHLDSYFQNAISKFWLDFGHLDPIFKVTTLFGL